MERNKIEYEEVLEIIGQYYPLYYAFSEKKYHNSVEHIRYNNVINNLSTRSKKEELYYNILCSIFKNYYVKRWTNTTYPSIQFSILLHENQPVLDDDIDLMKALNGRRFNLEIFISRISPYYYLYTSEENLEDNRWDFKVHSETYIIDEEFLKRLDMEMQKIHMVKISRELVHKEVPFVETELLPYGEQYVTIFNCLFSDMITTYY